MARVVKTPDERRSELIAAAKRLFYEKGYKRTSVNDIVAEVGVAKGTFYHYFDSKTAVLEAVVGEIVAQTMAILQAIVSDPSLSAISKWQQAMQATGNWKIEHKDELLKIRRILLMEENVLFERKLRTQVSKMTSQALAEIIAQGVDEKVFAPQMIAEAADIVVTLVMSLGESVNVLLFNPENYEDPAALAQRKNTAVQTAIERVLCAPPGSLPIIDDQTLNAWFIN